MVAPRSVPARLAHTCMHLAAMLRRPLASAETKQVDHKLFTCGHLWLQMVALLVRLPQCTTTAGADPCPKVPSQR